MERDADGTTRKSSHIPYSGPTAWKVATLGLIFQAVMFAGFFLLDPMGMATGMAFGGGFHPLSFVILIVILFPYISISNCLPDQSLHQVNLYIITNLLFYYIVAKIYIRMFNT